MPTDEKNAEETDEQNVEKPEQKPRGSDRKNRIRADFRDVTRDPREGEEWFDHMPENVQDEMREYWQGKRVRFVDQGKKRKAWLKRCVTEGIFIHGVPGVMMLPIAASIWPLVLAIPFGVLTGAIFFYLDSGRITSGCIAIVTTGLQISVSGAAPGIVFIFALPLIFAAGLIAAATGLRRELDATEMV